MTTSENLVGTNGSLGGITDDVRVVTEKADDDPNLPFAEEMGQEGSAFASSDSDVLIVGRPHHDSALHDTLQSLVDDVVIIDINDEDVADIPMAEYLDDNNFREGDVLDLTTNQLFSSDSMPSVANALANLSSGADPDVLASQAGNAPTEPIENA